MRLAAITSSGACGIADYADQLIAALKSIDLSIEVMRDPAWLDPEAFWHWLTGPAPAGTTPTRPVVWLNHHAALHARWTPEWVRRIQGSMPVVATLHDTRAGNADSRNSAQLMRLYEVCDATIVHEPVADLPGAHYIRHGVPLAQGAMQYGPGRANDVCFKSYDAQPVLGTVGFAFPWKCIPEMSAAAHAAGWAQVILSNNATDEQEAEWRSINPDMLVVREFLPQTQAISYLSGCDATATLYRCANNGTSGAFRQCLGARKPVFSFRCRQMRDIEIAEREEWGIQVIRWTEDFDSFRRDLTRCPIQRIDPGIAFIAEQDSWPRQAEKYLTLFRSVLGG